MSGPRNLRVITHHHDSPATSRILYAPGIAGGCVDGLDSLG